MKTYYLKRNISEQYLEKDTLKRLGTKDIYYTKRKKHSISTIFEIKKPNLTSRIKLTGNTNNPQPAVDNLLRIFRRVSA